LTIDALEQPERPFHAIFIRAPLIESVGQDVDVLAEIERSNDKARIVAAQEGRLLATSFHPELTGDDRFHRYFVKLIEENN
jgi:5'-phosphate synthase pdxT subunit